MMAPVAAATTVAKERMEHILKVGRFTDRGEYSTNLSTKSLDI